MSKSAEKMLFRRSGKVVEKRKSSFPECPGRGERESCFSRFSEGFINKPPREKAGKAGFASLTRPSAIGRGEAENLHGPGKAKRTTEMPKTEMWIDVPGHGGRIQVSNLGHLRRLAKMQPLGRGRVKCIFGVKQYRGWCDFMTRRIGWNVYCDGAFHFFDREKLMSMFDGVPVEIDTVDDRGAVEARDRAWNKWIAGQADEVTDMRADAAGKETE